MAIIYQSEKLVDPAKRKPRSGPMDLSSSLRGVLYESWHWWQWPVAFWCAYACVCACACACAFPSRACAPWLTFSLARMRENDSLASENVKE